MTPDTQEMVTRLRYAADHAAYEPHLHHAAADALTAQAEEIRALKEALITIRDKRGQCNRAADCQAVARAALAGKGEP